jgi:ATP-dependent Clp protease adaptor protein ClpS
VQEQPPVSGKPKTDGEQELLEQQRIRSKKPPLFRVLIHDDDFTTMDFVVEILVTVFHHPRAEAVRIMLDVHHRGIGLAGVYPHELAETKAARVTEAARANEFPLLCTVEPVEG